MSASNMPTQVVTIAAISTPHAAPSALDWENHKQTITDLYRQHTLHDVRRIMDQRHGFKATERMYRTRIKSWRIDKKLKDRDAKAVVRIVRQRREVGLAAPTFRLRGKDITVADALRHLKRKGLSPDDVDETGSETPSDLSVVIDGELDSEDSPRQQSLEAFQCKEPSRSPSTPNDAWHTLYFASQISNYYDASLQLPAITGTQTHQSSLSPWDVFNLYLCGAGLQKRNDASGWPLMARSLELMNTVFLEQDPSLMPQILDLHLRPEVQTTNRPDRAVEFLELMQGWSESLLGTHHPITLVCYAIMSSDLDPDSRLLTDRIIAASFERYKGKADPSTKSARIAICRTLHQLRLFEEARSAWCTLILDLESLDEEDDDWIRACLLGLASTYLNLGDVENVHCVLHNLFERMIVALGLEDAERMPTQIPSERYVGLINDCVRRSQIRIAEAEALIKTAMALVASSRSGPPSCRSIKFMAMMREINRQWNTAGKFDSARCLKLYYKPMIERTQAFSSYKLEPLHLEVPTTAPSIALPVTSMYQ